MTTPPSLILRKKSTFFSALYLPLGISGGTCNEFPELHIGFFGERNFFGDRGRVSSCVRAAISFYTLTSTLSRITENSAVLFHFPHSF